MGNSHFLVDGLHFITMKEINGIIYIYTNKLNGKVYIGQTKHEEERKAQHLRAYDNTPFETALREEGISNFEYSVLYRVIGWDDKLISKVLDSMEQYYIACYNSTVKSKGYNITIGGSPLFYERVCIPLKCIETGYVYDNLNELIKHIHISPIKAFYNILKREPVRGKHYVYTGDYNIPSNYPTE